MADHVWKVSEIVALLVRREAGNGSLYLLNFPYVISMFRRYFHKSGCQHPDDVFMLRNDLMRLVQVIHLESRHLRSIVTDHSIHVLAPSIRGAKVTFIAFPFKAPVVFGYCYFVACQHFDGCRHTTYDESRYGVWEGAVRA